METVVHRLGPVEEGVGRIHFSTRLDLGPRALVVAASEEVCS